MHLRRLGFVAGLLAALAIVPVASAATPVSTISIHVIFGGSETFTTTGGVLCPDGVAVTGPFMGAGGGSKGAGNFTFHLIKTLTCTDGSGTFQIKVEAANTRKAPGTVGGFAVVGGTGAYASLSGAGSLVGTGFDGGVDDLYTGRLSR